MDDSDIRETRDGRFDALLEELQRLRGQKDQLERALDGVLGSASWRVTAPLRAGVAFVRSLWPLWRRRVTRLELSGLSDVERVGGRFRVCGAQPQFELVGDVPSGWVLIRGALEHERGHQSFLLYYDEGEGFLSDRRYWLTLEKGQALAGMFRLPPGVRAIRLDPFDTEGDVGVSELEFIEIGNLQVLLGLLERYLKPALLHPGILIKKFRSLCRILREGGLTGLKAKFASRDMTCDYQEWIRHYDTFTDKDRVAVLGKVTALARRPLFSVVMPVFNTPEKFLRAAIESVRGQLYDNWELCIADDASSEPSVRRVLEEYAALDRRIRVLYRAEQGHISRASNSALELASGDFVALLDHDDELTPDALYVLADEINRYPEASLIYSDEDKISEVGVRHSPYFKCDWNPDLLLSQNYICHLLCVSRELVMAQGGFREGLDGAQDWDLILRVAEGLSEAQIRHVPHVLYHWRVIKGSTARSTSYKPYVMKAQARVVEEHLKRLGVEGARVSIRDDISQLAVSFPLPEKRPLVSLIIPTRDLASLLKRCVDSILAGTEYDNFEILIIDNGSVETATFDYFEKLKGEARVRIIRDESPFNFSRLNNQAVKEARGELIGFLNNDLEVIRGQWLSELASHALRPEIGVVGARLLYPNGLVQHAGVVLGIGGVAGHNHKGQPRHHPGYFNRAILMQNFSAVTGACMLMRRAVFEEAGGFDENELAVAFNDIDLCLKVRGLGYRIVYCPEAELYHHESASRGHENTPQKFARFEREIEVMKKRWGAVLLNDPYYSPNLSHLTEDFAFAFPPRVAKAWD